MTSAERNALLKLIARNARVAAADIDSVAADRMAEFERQASKMWEAEDLGVRQLIDDANKLIEPILAEAASIVATRCDELGIAAEFRPQISGGAALGRRGWGASNKDRRVELKALARAEIDAARKRAKVQVERRRSEIETQVLATGIDSIEGRALLESLPRPEQLVQHLDLIELKGRVDGAK